MGRRQKLDGDSEAIEIYRSLEAARSSGGTENTSPEDQLVPRVRLAADIDLERADPDCERCAGSGVKAKRTVEGADRTLQIPVICQCVVARGGVRSDELDRIESERLQ